ncbi:MAG TPA: DUF1684 domain-containing protein [Vicinamibacterales bacterium]|nr:DUF1684 domain-containing protein [Vicinamibacterales bacterium]
MTRTTLLLVTLIATGAAAQGTYDEAALKAFRAEREKILLADNGWFTVAGLHFLNPGENTFGSDPLNDIVLEFADVPKHAGVITMNGTNVTIKAADGTTLTYNGAPVSEGPLRLAERGRPADLITYKSTSFFLHYSGPRLAIRVRDQNAPLRKSFSGLKWYPANPSARVIGQFTPLASPKTVQAPNILGDLEPFAVPGTVAVTIGGKTANMEAWRSGERLWFVFRDLTSADTTYPSARFLYTDAPGPDGKVVMDFNRAQNPPCAYNPWTTCPLPPAANKLAVRIEAGEKRYHAEATSNAAVRK